MQGHKSEASILPTPHTCPRRGCRRLRLGRPLQTKVRSELSLGNRAGPPLRALRPFARRGTPALMSVGG
eukprot:scaffold2364_cov426-Prasinococcus_capsulatus_cf.AAC.13